MVIIAFSNLRLLVAVLGLLVLAAPPISEAAITCTQVRTAISPCMGYLGGAVHISRGCCPGISGLKRQASARADRQAVCSCLKRLAANYGNRIGRAQGLLTNCRVSIGYRLSLSIDCNRVT